MHWNHRTIEHRNVNETEHDGETYLSVHEVYYGVDDEVGTEGMAFVVTPASPNSVEDCQRLERAFGQPPVAWVDDTSYFFNEETKRWDYKTYGWITD